MFTKRQLIALQRISLTLSGLFLFFCIGLVGSLETDRIGIVAGMFAAIICTLITVLCAFAYDRASVFLDEGHYVEK